MYKTISVPKVLERSLPTIYASPASHHKRLEKLGSIILRTALGYIKVLEEEILVPVVLHMSTTLEMCLKDNKDTGELRNCSVDNTLYPFLSLEPGKADLVPLLEEQDTPKGWEGSVASRLLSEIEEFAECAGGITIQLHAPTPSGFYEPFPSEHGVFHLFPGMLPMFERGYHFPNEAFGVNLETAAGYRAFRNPIPGRGIALSDGKIDVVQIVGNNIYLLFDMFDMVLDVGFTVFRKSLALALNHLLGRERNTEPTAATSESEPQSLAQLIEEFSTKGFAHSKKEISKKLVELREAEEKVTRLKSLVREMKRLRDILMQANFMGSQLQQLLTLDYERIRAHPQVAHVAIVKDIGFQVTTRPIVILHDSVKRLIGEFVMQYEFGGYLSIWPLVAHHPKGVPHPHISAWNGPCFGNARTAIMDANIEFHYYDSVCYNIDWLTIGYTPELVVYNKVEEWPLLESVEPPKESA